MGTETALVALVDDVRRGLDRGCTSLLILLDLSVVFNTVDHGSLLMHLVELGVSTPGSPIGSRWWCEKTPALPLGG